MTNTERAAQLEALTMAKLIDIAKGHGLKNAKRTGVTKVMLVGRILAHEAEQMTNTEQVAEVRHGSKLVAALEDLYNAIRRRHPDLPEVMLRTGTGKLRKNEMRWAHYETGAWRRAKEDGVLPEMFIAGERLALGAEAVLTAMLHEAAHGLADVDGIKDVTGRNGYHNRKFVQVAEVLGMRWPENAEPHQRHGFSQVELTEETAADYFLELVTLEEAITWCRDAGMWAAGANTREGGHGTTRVEGEKAESTRSRTARKLECDGCRAIIRASRATIALGAITHECGGTFVPEEEAE